MEIKQDDNLTYIQVFYKKHNNNKSVLFDLDHTIIKPKNNKTFYKKDYSGDWEYVYPCVKNKLREINNTHNIYIITNQKVLKTNRDKQIWLDKIKLVLEDLDIPIVIFAALSSDSYRKPQTESINILKLKVDKNSYYCGDALGRKRDFSDTDLKFALNLNIKIYSPEYIFLNKTNDKPKLTYPIIPMLNISNFEYDFRSKELIILVGPPASGKSSLSKKLIIEHYKTNKNNIIIINQDKLKSLDACLKITKQSLENSDNIIIDNTNSNRDTRKLYIDLAKKYNYIVTCIIIDITRELCEHNNLYRASKNKINLIPDIAYRMYYKKYSEPNKEEGIDNIKIINPMCPFDLDYFRFFY